MCVSRIVLQKLAIRNNCFLYLMTLASKLKPSIIFTSHFFQISSKYHEMLSFFGPFSDPIRSHFPVCAKPKDLLQAFTRHREVRIFSKDRIETTDLLSKETVFAGSVRKRNTNIFGIKFPP